MSRFESFSFLAFNFCASVAVIFVNKLIFVSFRFNFTTLLTAIHYIMTLLGLELLAACGVYEKKASPTTPRLLLLSAVVGIAPALNNLSLSLNRIGFYQVIKLLVTPAIVGLEASLYGISISVPRALSLVAICLGVGLACIYDVELNWGGCVAALCWLPVASVYKVLWSRVAKEERWHTLALMRRVLPLSTVFLLGLVPLIDPPGALHFHWTLRRAALVAVSGVAAFFVNWWAVSCDHSVPSASRSPSPLSLPSALTRTLILTLTLTLGPHADARSRSPSRRSGFLVMGACSALSHTVLGQLKACLIIVGGYFLFEQEYPLKALCGAVLAIVSMVAYTHFNLREQEAKLSKGDSVSAADGRGDAASVSDADESGTPLVAGLRQA